MKLNKIARRLSVAALMCSMQAFAAPLDSLPTDVNFNGNVTASTCTITGATANQIITLPDATIAEVVAMPTSSNASTLTPFGVETMLDIVGCSGDITVQATFSGTSGGNSAESFVPTSGTGSGVDFSISVTRMLDYGDDTNGVVPNSKLKVTPGVPVDLITTNGSAATRPHITYSIPMRLDMVRSVDAVASGDVSLLSTITLSTL